MSWQTRSLAMVMAATAGNEDLMKFAANLTIDSDELKEFSSEPTKALTSKKVPVNANTQDQQTQKNFDQAADKNSFDTLSMFGLGLENGKPGH